MDKYGIIGYPLGHTFSPQIHNPAFKALAIDAIYDVYPIHPDDFDKRIAELKAGSVKGLNVTIPYKQRIIPFLDEIDPLAQKVNAVNTIKKQGTRWYGYNTDLYGFLLPLKNDLERIKSVLVIGAGGAANAVCFALLDAAPLEKMTIANRTTSNAEGLQKRLVLYYNLPVKTIPLQNTIIEKYDLIVNTTSVGMGKMSDQNPYDISPCWHKNTIVYDLIYNPKETRLLLNAKSQKLITINGLDMLIGQAMKSFFIWTNRAFPGEVINKDIFYK